ncbi:YlxR family protein [Cellulosimicrobium cellulans]|uniref:YlxR family protein n=1 Tax=Cellulosimicrobium cellulans TaxID=1710 RepID=UPI003C5E0D18
MPPDSTTRPVPTGSGPVRTCVGCRQRDLRSALLRLVLDRSGAGTDEPRLVVDAGRSLPGRGAWLHASTRCLETAERRRAVPRALHVAGPLDLAAVRAVIEARPGEHL